MSFKPCGRIGYWFSEKKGRKFNLTEMTDVFKTAGLTLVKIDLNVPLKKQDPFDAIVHKMSDIVVKADYGDQQSKDICNDFQDYEDNHPNLVNIDSICNIRKLLHRNIQYKLVAESELCKQGTVFIPAFVELTTNNVSENLAKMKAAGINFPIVCKPSLAHGAPLSHQMCLIFNEDGLRDVSPPCVVQKIVNHNAVLYKLLIIGEKYFIIERPSLKNLYPSDQTTIFFDSNDISKPHSACELTELDDNEQYLSVGGFPEKEKMDKIVQVLHELIGLNLLNIDVIADNATGHYAIVDINVFPGYPEIHNFYTLLSELVSRKIEEKLSGVEMPYKPILVDCISSPILAMKREKQQSKLNSIVFQNQEPLLKCFCCPISGNSCNSIEHLTKSSVETQSMHLSRPNSGLILIHKLNGAQDDSGIETSDSCDEKRKASHKTTKYQHSKILVPNGDSV